MAHDATVRGTEFLQAAIYGDPRSLQILSHHFLDALDTAHSSPCPTAVQTALFVFYQGPASDASRRARKHHPEVFTACGRFLMQPRTPEQLSILSRELETSAGHFGCDLTRPLVAALHRPDQLSFKGRPGLEEEVTGFFALTLPDCMAGVLFHMLTDVDNKVLSSRLAKASRSRIHHSWPRSQSDIVPYGESTSIAGLAAWVAVSKNNNSIHQLVSVIYNVVNYNLHSDILVSTLFPEVFVPSVTSFLDEWEHAPLCSPGTALRRLHYLDGVGRRDVQDLMNLSRNQIFVLTARHSIDLLSLLDLFQRVVRVVAYNVIAVPRYAERASVSQSTLLHFEGGAGYLHSILGLPHEPNLYPPGTLRYSAIYLIELKDLYRTLLMLSSHLLPPAICGNPSCTRTTFSEGRSLAYCAGCGGISYCSRACQKVGWRYQLSPHRSSCAAVALLKRRTREAKLTAVEAAQMMSVLREGIPLETAKALVAHFEAVYTRQ